MFIYFFQNNVQILVFLFLIVLSCFFILKNDVFVLKNVSEKMALGLWFIKISSLIFKMAI